MLCGRRVAGQRPASGDDFDPPGRALRGDPGRAVAAAGWLGIHGSGSFFAKGFRSRPGRRVPARGWAALVVDLRWGKPGAQDVRGRSTLTNTANARMRCNTR